MPISKASLCVLAALASAISLQAQCHEALTGSGIGTGDDVVLPMQSLGFAFPFAGTTYTDVHIETNGRVFLSNAGVPAPGLADYTPSTGELVAGSPKICPYWTDLVITSGSGNVLFNALPGKAVITWENAVEFPSAATSPQFTIQMQLLASGEIVIAYDGRCVLTTAGDLLVGMSPGGGAAVPAPSDYLAAGVTSGSTCFELFNLAPTPFDLTGKTLQLVPAAPNYAFVATDCAGSNVKYGQGCYRVSNSFYQLTTAPAVSSAALSNTAITMFYTGTGYVTVGAGAWVPPTGAATALTLGDDAETTTPALTTPFPYPGGTTSTFTVCSNGFVSVATGNPTGYIPTVATMLNNPQTGWYSWHDYNPAASGSGQVKFEQVGSIAYITWDGVYNYSGTSAADATYLQFQFDTSNGSVTIAYLSVSANTHTLATGEPHLVGYSPGGTSSDPGSITFATALPVTVSTTEMVPLTLSAAPSPVSTPTSGSTVVFTIDNIPELVPTSGVYVALYIASLGQVPPPGLDLAVIGAPGCALLVQTLDLTIAALGASPTASVSLTLPPGLPTGLQIFSQGAGLFTPNTLPNGQNAFGGVTSNGVASTIGVW